MIRTCQIRTVPKPEKEESVRNRILVLTLGLIATVTASGAAHAQNCLIKSGNNCPFVMPFSGDVYLQQMGGSAGATTTFGLGTSPSNFVPYYTGLPNDPSPTGGVYIGYYTEGTTLNFGMYTTFGQQEGWAFSVRNDVPSVVSFSDPDNNLGMNGSIIQQLSPYTWLLHLDDALSYLYDDDDNDVLMLIKIVPSR